MSPFRFDWDEGNLRKMTKHLINDKEGESAFYDARKIIRYDSQHSDEELRYVCIAKSNQNRILFVVFTIRAGKIRIISARKANKKEERAYQQGT